MDRPGRRPAEPPPAPWWAPVPYVVRWSPEDRAREADRLRALAVGLRECGSVQGADAADALADRLDGGP